MIQSFYAQGTLVSLMKANTDCCAPAAPENNKSHNPATAYKYRCISRKLRLYQQVGSS